MKFKQVLAGLLVGTMVVTSAPVSGLGALSALAASEEAETKNYNYTKLTEGLTASADCANGTNTMNAVLNGNSDDYWHSAWEGDNQPVKQGGEVIMNSNNNITLTLTEASTVKKLEYVSNGAGNNGTITKCNIYYKTSAENAEFKKVQEDPYTLSFTESKATIEFTDAISDVKEIKIEVLNTAGDPNNTFISGKELYVYRDDSTKIDSGNILAKAECSSQGDAALKNLVDNNEATGYHSSWGGNGGTVAADEGFTEIVRPGTMTTPTELISRNNLYINLAGSETIGKIAYLPRQGSGNGVANGRITAANIYISNADVNDVSAITDWKQVATADWENNSDEKNVTFSPETAKHIRIEVKHSAGDQTDAYINAAAIDIYKAEEVVAEDKVISKPVLTAVAPVTGETPADVTAAEPEGYTVATAWADSDGNTVTEFEDGKDYTLTATLTAEKGYKFTDESKPSTIKVGEEDLEVTAEVKDSGKTMTLTYTFKGAEIGGDSVLSKPEITVTAPVKDAEPKDAQTDGFGYAATSKWTNKDGNSVTKFEAGQDYTLTIALKAEEGNIFDETSIPEKIQVGEKEVAVNASDVVISGEGKIMTLTLVFSVPADEVQYAKLEGLTGKADSEELEHDGEGEDGAIDNALDGNIETFWHTNWSDDSKAKVTYSDGKLTGNNTYTITLAKASTVTSLTYMPRNHYDGSGNIANGAISECEVYVSTDHGKNWTLAGKAEGETAWNYVKETEDGADQNFVERTVTFDKTYAGVTDVKVKAIKTAGVQANMFINAAEFGVIGKEDTETPEVSEARKALAAALADAEKVESADKYTEDSYKTFKEAWDAANAVTDETKDEDVQTIADTLANAIKALKKAETPAPPVTEDSVITAPRLSYTAPVAGETAVVPSYVAMEDQSAKPATLEVKDDVPTTVVVDGGVLAFQGRLTAPNNGANNDKFDVSGDTPMVLRTKVKLNNKTDEVVNILGKMDSQYGIQVDGANDRVILYCCDAQDKWPEVQYKYDADTFWGKWHDIALVYTGTNMQLYVDGKAGEATPGRVNASDGYQVVFKSYASSIFTIGYNTEKSTNHEADGNGVKYSTLDQVDGKIADIKLYKGTDYSEGLTKSYDEIKAALEKVAPDADISAIPYTAVTTWSANGTALEKDAKFAGETVYTATTVYTARSGFKFTDISKPSVDGDATVTIAADGKTMTVTKEFPRTAKIVCSCVVGEITGVADQTIDLGVADSKTVTLNAKAQVTGDCKVEGHDGTVNYTYTVTDAGTTGATVTDNAVTVTAAGTAKVKVTATLASDATKTSTKEITLTVTTNKASAEDKANLAAEIASVKDLKEADYTEESYAALKTALATANGLTEKTNASKAEVDAAIEAIRDAKKGLVRQEDTDLEKAKENAANTLKDAAAIADAGQKDYEEASWKVFDAAYKALKNAPADADKATLESLTLALRNAQAALKKAETPAVALDAPKVKAAKAKVTKTGVVVNVTVEAVKDAASYDVYRVVKGKATKVGTTAAGKTTVKDKKAIKGASYYAVAVSKDGKAVSKAGAAVAVKLAKAPKIQKATAGSKNAKLSWKKVKGAKVVVYRSTKKNSGYKKVATTRKNATSVTNKKGLKAGKTYYYKIATIKGKLISAMSKAKRVKIKK
ncbi:MAG: hypothetical protein EGR73_07355 [Lachnospiraceae bacterium]|nr:hypothetical protein [Lachnospiraceae bacterium]